MRNDQASRVSGAKGAAAAGGCGLASGCSFDVKPTSRLGCQARVGESDVVFEITEESLRTYLDEHPAERRSLAEKGPPADAAQALRARLAKVVKR